MLLSLLGSDCSPERSKAAFYAEYLLRLGSPRIKAKCRLAQRILFRYKCEVQFYITFYQKNT